MDVRDLARPVGLLAGMTLVAGTLAVGYLVTRDRESLRRLVRVAAASVERVSVALAETREELEDLWAQARDEARQEIEGAAFNATPPAEAETTEQETEPVPEPMQESAHAAARTAPDSRPRARRRAE
jgi:hypothetical protein